MFGKRYSCNVIPSEVEGSFWHTGIASYVRQQGRGIHLRRKQESAECKEYFSTVLEMTVWGGYFMCRTTDMFGKRYSCIVIPSEVEGSFWHTGIASYVRQQGRGIHLRRKQESAECKEYFSTVLEMTVWGGYFMCRTTDMFGKRYSCIVIPSEVEGSFLQEGIMSYVG